MASPAKCGVEISDLFIEGSRFGFLFVHRLGGTPADLAYVAEGLGASGFTVSVPLLYGHGGSRALLGATTWEQWYGSVAEAHEELVQCCDKVVVGGLGVGALLALKLAAGAPSAVDGCVLFSPTFWPNGWAMPWYGGALRLIGHKRLANLFRFDERPPYGIKDEVLRRTVLDDMARRDARSSEDVLGRAGGALLEVKWLAKEVMPKLADVRQPALIFHPRYDDRSRLSASQLLQKRLGGIVNLVVLEDSYHLVTLDRQRELVLDRVRHFADELSNEGAELADPPPA
ncbi:MAG: alpha/beta hydrolase [Hyphomicrobiaceae bacterium]